MNDLHHESCWELVSTWSSAAWCIVALQHRDELTRLVLQEQPVKTFFYKYCEDILLVPDEHPATLFTDEDKLLLISDQDHPYDRHLDEVPVLPPDSADLKHVSNVISCCLHLINKQTIIRLLSYDGHHNITINPKSAKCEFNIKAGSIYRPVWCYLVDEIQPSTVHPDFHQLPSKRCLQLVQVRCP